VESEKYMNFTEHTKVREEKFGSVVFDTLTEKIFITDPLGGEILHLIKQGKDLPEIVEVMTAGYDGDKQVIEKDIIEFAETLKTNQIVSA